ncbi:hypothetical protein C482_11982 [Natrialba chahannaoensis JCM 10990]|uniref:Uncharacterized protein n=1 Tax=Natrialba chahannaoensis JCM 10990 TaxID=1227492 RepID=M0AK00_9EURY|nr:hypothetical protein [Natrialba chahannaoensis]ELY98237.1 hypothetical protein C482_11982 [Natrialba chahannaoensis JCM 10990]
MAEDNTDRANEYESERKAEIEDELERIDRDPDEINEGSTDVGSQSAPRRDERSKQDGQEAEEPDELEEEAEE